MSARPPCNDTPSGFVLTCNRWECQREAKCIPETTYRPVEQICDSCGRKHFGLTYTCSYCRTCR